MSVLQAHVNKRKLVWMTVVSIIFAFMIIAQAYLIVTIIEAVFLNDASLSSVIPAFVLLFFVISIRALMNYMNGRIGIGMAAVAKKHLRMDIFRQFTKQPIQLVSQTRSGEKVSTLLNVVEEVDSYYSQYMPKIIQAAVVPIILLIGIVTQNSLSALILLITSPFIPLFMAIIGMKTKQKAEQQLNELSAFSGQFLDALQGLRTLRLFGHSEQEKKRIKEGSIRFREATLGVLRVAFVSSFMMELISMLSMGLIALQLALGLIVFDTIPFGVAFFVLLLAPEFYIALKELSSAFHTGRESITAGKKLEGQLKEEIDETTWGDEPITLLPPRLDIHHVSFSYDGKQILTDIHTSIDANSYVAIVGKSGAGKTTLLNVIARLVPVHVGEIIVNNTPQRHLRENEWFQQLSYISQHPYIFGGSIFENIAIGTTSQTSRSDVVRAAQQAGLSDVIHSLDDGMDTIIGQGGRGLSGGEKQRLALARAFLKKPSLILFDEPTVGLDLKTEQILDQSIQHFASEATVITVAHRMHTIKRADKIIVLDHGRMIACGTHEELLKSNAHYQALVSPSHGGVNE